MEMVTNQTQALIPQTNFEGPMLAFDFPAVHIGVAEYDEGPTGCTVFYFPQAPAATAIDIRGGQPGTMGGWDFSRAICLAGGSVPGLEAATGVFGALWERGGFDIDGFPAVSGAILHDYRARATRIYPDLALGRAALLAARPGVFPLGARGAGRCAWCGSVVDSARAEPSGQGGAFREEGPTKVAVFSVVNAAGVILDRQGQVVRGNRDSQTGLRSHPLHDLRPTNISLPEPDAMPREWAYRSTLPSP
jgi:6-aminohexanoate-oligomer endohydrolase